MSLFVTLRNICVSMFSLLFLCSLSLYVFGCKDMVIYRRKSLGKGHWPPDIPSYVESLLVEEPLDAEEDGEAITVSLSKLTVCFVELSGVNTLWI